MSILIHGVSLPKNRAMVLVLNPNGNCVDEFGNAFAVDARPTDEGEWLVDKNGYPHIVCSRCGVRIPIVAGWCMDAHMNFCPNCGKPMK